MTELVEGVDSVVLVADAALAGFVAIRLPLSHTVQEMVLVVVMVADALVVVMVAVALVVVKVLL